MTYSDLFEKELRKIISAEIERLMENISHGMGITDYAQYTKMIGEIGSLRKTLEFCEEARTIANQNR